VTDFGGQTVLVTGAASGIGAAVARALVERGAKVAAFDSRADGLGKLSSALGDRIAPYEVDVTNERAVGEAVCLVESTQGPLHGLVCAAGVLVRGELLSDDLDATRFRQALSVNLEGVWLVARAVARRMVSRASGSIVTVSSNAASTPRVGLGAYCASKAAATMLTRCLGLELARHGIRCNVVSPGSTDTPMLRSLVGGETERAVLGDPASFRLGIPLGRVALPKDVAEAVIFLLSNRSRHITLHDLRVDGGATF
jgi:2,3-dihydro-2,3-dihydroxybenzoate dehydrogenase